MREKAKVVLALMEDEEKLKEERESALKTREKTSKNAAGEGVMFTPSSLPYHCRLSLSNPFPCNAMRLAPAVVSL